MSFHLPGLACRRGSHCLQAQGCDTKKEQKFVHICSSAGPVQGEGKSLTVTFQGACQVAVLMPTALCRDLCLKQTCSQIEGEQRAWSPYLVGVGREEGQCSSQASLSSQEVGILAHLLSQKGAHGVWVHSLCELHGFAQDHDLLY